MLSVSSRGGCVKKKHVLIGYNLYKHDTPVFGSQTFEVLLPLSKQSCQSLNVLALFVHNLMFSIYKREHNFKQTRLSSAKELRK